MNIKLLHGNGFTLEIDGKFYRPGKRKGYTKDGIKHSLHTEFTEFHPDEHQVALEKVGKLLRETIPPERVMEELLKRESTEYLNKLAKKLEKGDIIAKSHDGCLGLALINKKKKKSQYFQVVD